MRFVAVKTEEQQARGMLFRTRDLLGRERTQTINDDQCSARTPGGVRRHRSAGVGPHRPAGMGSGEPGLWAAGAGPGVGRASARSGRRVRGEDRRPGDRSQCLCAPGRRGRATDDDAGDRAGYGDRRVRIEQSYEFHPCAESQAVEYNDGINSARSRSSTVIRFTAPLEKKAPNTHPLERVATESSQRPPASRRRPIHETYPAHRQVSLPTHSKDDFIQYGAHRRHVDPIV